jgi:2-polyprenyl-3-methyl-5-hydroxy-6-metoxy-1,4-benzoquinol methylase
MTLTTVGRFLQGCMPKAVRRLAKTRLRKRVDGVPTPEAEQSQPQKANPWNTEMPYDYSTMWFGAEVCQAYITERTSGSAGLHWLSYAIKNYMLVRAPEDLARCRVLVLGASEGYAERELRSHGFTGEIVSTDIADQALARAKQRSEQLGYHNIRHVIHDLNVAPGDKFGGQFDFIVAEGVLHHIANIESCLRMCNALLQEDGYVFAVEFEGPFRFQLSELQTRWINAALNVMPRCLRPFPHQYDGHYPATAAENRHIPYVVPPEKAIARMDPSEALVGPELQRLIPEIFAVTERKGFGGTLLSYMTAHFDFKRSNTDPFAARWLKVLMEVEHALIDTGILHDEFVFYVLQKKAAV